MLNGVFSQIDAACRNLPVAEKKIAGYILDHVEAVPFMSIYKLAEKVQVSSASVSRLAISLGYKNFKDLKIALARDSAPVSTSSEFYEEIKKNDSDKSIINKVFAGNVKSITDTVKNIDHEKLIEVAGNILKCERLLFFGMGSSGNIAREAAMSFFELDIQAEAYRDPYEILIQAMRTDKKTVVIGISHTGETDVTVEALKISRPLSMLSVGITNVRKSSLEKYSDICLLTTVPRRRIEVAGISSQIAQLSVISVIFFLVAAHQKNRWDIKALDTVTRAKLKRKK
ncbi:MAG: MurR/RpiR family transcriptional regulator [Victivallales bacterium]